MKPFVAFAMMFAASQALADQRGNGGDVVVCHDDAGQLKSVELLDFYEGRSRLGFALDLAAGTTWQEKLAHALTKIGAVDPDRATAYQRVAEAFESNTHFWPGVVLSDIPDSAHIAIPRGCAIAQIAIQREPTFPEEKYFTVSLDLWEKLDEAGKAGLVLHEIVFHEALRIGHENSILTRYFNALVTSRGFVPENLARYLAVAKSMKFGLQRVRSRGLYFKVNDQLELHPNGLIAEGQLAENGRWRLPDGQEIGLLAPYSGWAGGPTFHANGVLASGNLVEDTTFALSDGGSILSVARYPVYFDEAGRLTSAHVGLTPTTVAIGGYDVTLTHHVYVHEGRFVTGGYLRENLAVTMCGRPLLIGAPTTIEFDEARTHLRRVDDIDRPTELCFRDPDGGAFTWRRFDKADYLTFDEAGAVRRIVLADKLRWRIQGREIFVSNEIVFHPNGRVAETYAGEFGLVLRTTAGTDYTVPHLGARLKFDEAGLLVVP